MSSTVQGAKFTEVYVIRQTNYATVKYHSGHRDTGVDKGASTVLRVLFVLCATGLDCKCFFLARLNRLHIPRLYGWGSWEAAETRNRIGTGLQKKKKQKGKQ